MAWTTPKLWTVGEMTTAALLNTHVRDNLNQLGTTHVHGGAAGDGSDSIGDVDIVTVADQSASPGAVGTLQQNGTGIEWHDGSNAIIINRIDAGVATASLRTLGTDGTQAAAGNHSHN